MKPPPSPSCRIGPPRPLSEWSYGQDTYLRAMADALVLAGLDAGPILSLLDDYTRRLTGARLRAAQDEAWQNAFAQLTALRQRTDRNEKKLANMKKYGRAPE